MTTPRMRLMPSPPLVRPIRVLYLIDSLGPGGAERLMVDLLPHLRELGVEGRVVALQERHGNPIAADLAGVGFPVETVGIARLRERGALARVSAAIEGHTPDVVHTQLEFADILGTIAARRLGIPSVSTIHTLDRPKRWTKKAARFRLMAWTLRRRADLVIAVSESSRTHVLARAGLDKRQTTTIHNGIDLRPFLAVGGQERESVRKRLGIDPSAPVIVTVAVLRRLKGIHHIIDALPAIRATHPDATYVVVGDGAHRAELEAHAQGLGLSDAVRFTGRRADVADHMAAADIFVLPSLTEALPTVVIEAMAAGLPVVATDVGGTAELVTPGDSGVLVPPGSPERLAEAVTRVLASPRHRTAMGAAGRRTAVARFSIERQAARLVDEYRVLTTDENPS